LRSWEASQRLRAHGRAGVGDDDCRFLRQVIEEELENKKPQIPENDKQIDKIKEKRKSE
jgi:hypothetical protein